MPIPSGGLVNNFDPINPASYPGSGTVWTDPVSSLAMDLYGSPTYDGTQGTFAFTNGTTQKAYSAAGSYSNLTSTWSVSIWVKISDITFLQPVWINGKRDGSAPSNGYVLFFDPGSGKFDFGANDLYGFNSWSPTVVQDQWYNLTFTFTGGTLSTYVDGIASNVYTGQPNANAYTSASLFGVGHPGVFPDDVKCVVGPILTYNTALSGTQVTDIYNTYYARFFGPPPPPAPTGLVGGRTFGQGFAG
jgi:hypothetical protein